MCIIVICEKRHPSLNELLEMQRVNSDGAGVAWREENYVRWKKGLNAKEVYELIQKIDYPYVIHFRLATCEKSPYLCHPFPVTHNVEMALEGKADRVLFHNGVWTNWRELCLQAVMKKNIDFLQGKVSDTRALAWFVYHYGSSVLNLLNEKVVIFSNKKILRFGEGWIEEDGITYSNKHYKYNYYYYNNSFYDDNNIAITNKNRKYFKNYK